MWPMFHAIDGPPSRSRRRAISSVMSVSATISTSSLNVSTPVSPCALSMAFMSSPPIRSCVLRVRTNRGYVLGGGDHPWAVGVIGQVRAAGGLHRDSNKCSRFCQRRSLVVEHDRWLTVDIAEDRTKRGRQLRVVMEIRRFAQWAFEPISDAQRGVGRTQRA